MSLVVNYLPFMDPPSLLSRIGLQRSEVIESVSSGEGTAGVLTATGIGRRPEEHLCTAMRHTLGKMEGNVLQTFQ